MEPERTRDEPPGRRRGAARSALSSALVLGLVAAASLGLARAAETGPSPPPAEPRSAVARAGDEPLQVAGSGANILLMRRLCAPLPGVRVHDSIGSGGGLAALRDGAIDVALVSRPVAAEERQGLRVVPIARTALVWATRSPIEAATRDELRRWYDGRGPLRPLLRELGDSGVRAVRQVAPAIAESHDAAVRARRAELLLTEDAMRDALARAPSSFGLTDLGQLTLAPNGAHPIRVDGVAPTLENVRAGRYPFVRELAVVVREDDARAQAFAERLTSPSMQAVVAASGYLPVRP